MRRWSRNAWFPFALFPYLVLSVTDIALQEHYATFETPTLTNTSYEAVKKLLLQGRPFVVLDGAKGLPMAEWDCEYVKQRFPDSRIRQEGSGEKNAIKMNSDWTNRVNPWPGSANFPSGAPTKRPFYWDIAKAYASEASRKWGKDPANVVKQIVENTAIPYWLPRQETEQMGKSSEMWFHPPGAGALAHMDPHCETTVSFCFSGRRKWRMMLPPADPHPNGYFDGEIYGVSDSSRVGEWQPIFEFDAPAGSAVVVFPGMIHETASVGEECSSSISQTFQVPFAAAYFRAFWPRFALIEEDVGACRDVVNELLTFGSRSKVGPARKKNAQKSGATFAAKIDVDQDGDITAEEVTSFSGGRLERSIDEYISFHDINEDGVISVEEVVESWVMFSTTARKTQKRRQLLEREL